jgi:hypothetical protein
MPFALSVIDKIKHALKHLLEEDSHLFHKDVDERSMTSQLAEYLRAEFPDYKVDCEYSKNGVEDKELFISTKKISKPRWTKVRPDIIIHNRGNNPEYNYIVIEAKKDSNSTSSMDSDRTKLRAYKKDLKYQYAFFVTFPVKNAAEDLGEDIPNLIETRELVQEIQ